MALRAAATACKFGGRQRNPTLFAIPLYLQLKLHHNQPQTFTSAAPIHQPGFKSAIRAISGAAADPITPPKKGDDQEPTPQNWKIKMLYDGDCPLCMREVDMLRERNKLYGTIKFVDISSDDYSPEENQRLDYKTAFRKLYEQVGLGWVYAVTKYEPIATIAGAIYGLWAKYRLQITGRPPLEEVLELRKKKGEVCKDGNACKLPE
ncbi:uncharacterized protein At5g50100, chloroplastic isoform X2 [Prunus dulcis]|uniref:uncharacterized protein At5g50100, chloroplastic isoform X2 n=1 Tax=Prunus dulcis TaxID=3755 RepID=UPI0014833EE7|nr:uncharacterized protein At5g50100, chloroplastic isoform X2 [Prunus dulcis]